MVGSGSGNTSVMGSQLPSGASSCTAAQQQLNEKLVQKLSEVEGKTDIIFEIYIF